MIQVYLAAVRGLLWSCVMFCDIRYNEVGKFGSRPTESGATIHDVRPKHDVVFTFRVGHRLTTLPYSGRQRARPDPRSIQKAARTHQTPSW